MAVSALVLEACGDEDLAIAALLHDAVEDQGGPLTLQIIRRMFGDRVATVVMECSDTDREPKPPWRKRKERYLTHLLSLGHPQMRSLSQSLTSFTRRGQFLRITGGTRKTSGCASPRARKSSSGITE